jgi:hypothetical protein
MLTRESFLRTGAAAALGAAVAPATALAALPTPAPVGDDEGYLQFGVLAERTSLAFYRRARAMKRTWHAPERARLTQAIGQKVAHVQRLNAVLGADAPAASDFAVALPRQAFATRGGALTLGRRLEGLLTGVYVGAVAFTADPATRLLLGRLLANDAQQHAALRVLAGMPAAAGLPDPVDLDTAGAELDRFLKSKGYPTS